MPWWCGPAVGWSKRRPGRRGAGSRRPSTSPSGPARRPWTWRSTTPARSSSYGCRVARDQDLVAAGARLLLLARRSVSAWASTSDSPQRGGERHGGHGRAVAASHAGRRRDPGLGACLPGGAFSTAGRTSRRRAGARRRRRWRWTVAATAVAVWRALQRDRLARSAPLPAATWRGLLDGGVSVSGLGKNVHTPQVAVGRGRSCGRGLGAREARTARLAPTRSRRRRGRRAAASRRRGGRVGIGTPGGPSMQPQVDMDRGGRRRRRVEADDHAMGQPRARGIDRGRQAGTFSPIVRRSRRRGAYVIEHAACDGRRRRRACRVDGDRRPAARRSRMQAGVYDAIAAAAVLGSSMPATGRGRPCRCPSRRRRSTPGRAVSSDVGVRGRRRSARARRPSHTYAGAGQLTASAITVSDAAGTADRAIRAKSRSRAPPAGRVPPMISRLRVSPCRRSRDERG